MRRRELALAAFMVVAMLASVGFAVAYASTAGTQWEGAALGIALCASAAALVFWGKWFLPPERAREEREALPSPAPARDAAVDAFADGAGAIVARKPWLVRLLYGTAGVLGIAALFPVASLGPAPADRLFRTKWRRGLRLVTEDGTPLRARDIRLGSVVTVFPEGFTGPREVAAMGNAATLLLRVDAAALRLAPERRTWAPNGFLAYSKICTHAGCPVALYLETSHELFCPCHQSTFDALGGGRPVFGPADRALPQLPIAIREDGFLVAQSDYREPIGPDFWERA